MKYIFIDSNQYRHIYSSSEGFSDEVYDLLLGLANKEHVCLLLPQQVKDEVERNRWRAWPETEEKDVTSKIESIEGEIKSFKDKYSEYKNSNKLLNDLEKKKKSLLSEKKKINKKFLNLKSKQNQKISNLFKKAKFIEETEEIIRLADVRFRKGNPPYGKPSKLGDALIWQSIIQYLKSFKGDKPVLILVANDKNAWGNDTFDPWLSREFKNITGGKVLYSKRLSDIPELTSEEQEKIRKEEETNLKENAISDFVNSRSFIGAGTNADKLLKLKGKFSVADYEKILRGSISNHEIYQSFFTPIPLKELVSGEGGYVVRELEGVSGELWRKFDEKFKTNLSRQSDINFDVPEEVNPEDIPF
ncbi:MAG TPA: PIN domain-containing protein [Candidatus Paceibacterota bacterium]|nr:PIN domain-containing protein [Candidatus Paceibacterota bacterium]